MSNFGKLINDHEKFRTYMTDSMTKKPMERIGISTGWKVMDYYMRGFHPGKLYVIGARTGDGKTSFGTTIAANILGISQRWGPVMYFSTELDENEIGAQIAEAHAGGTSLFPNGRSLTRDEIDRLDKATDDVKFWMAKRDLVVIKRTSFTTEEIGQAITEFRDGYHGGKLAMIIVDQASRIKRVGEKGISQNYTNATEAMLNGLEAMADEVECPLILFSQANRLAPLSNERPRMHHLKHSGAFEEYAHCVMMLERNEEEGDAIWIEKNRHGPVTKIDARFHGEAHTWEVYGD